VATKRRYTQRTKLAAVMAAEMTSLTETAKTTGIPKTTIKRWLDHPDYAQVRTNTREDLAEEIGVVAHLAWSHVARSLRDGTMEPRDAIFAAEKATSLQLLMTGGATARTETRDITGTLDDADVRDAIRAAEHYLGAGAGRAAETAAGTPEGEGV
jgi:transposase-like protein